MSNITIQDLRSSFDALFGGVKCSPEARAQELTSIVGNIILYLEANQGGEMNIIEQIKALPPSTDLPGVTDGTYGMVLRTNDLKVLAESHERLLQAAREWTSECRREFTDEELADDHEYQRSMAAIEQAEAMKI
jgi:hypothetical protein